MTTRLSGHALLAGMCMGLAQPARADELRVPKGMMLCLGAEAAISAAHAGCWLARGGQKVEIVALLPAHAELRIWSSDGSEAAIVYAARADAERLLPELAPDQSKP